MAETFSNGGAATVGVGGIDSSATTLPTIYRVGLPSSGVFRIRVESEIMKVTTGGQSTASWTVVRGQEGTTAASHAEGSAISQPLTAQALTDALASAGGGLTNPMTTSGDIIYGGASGAATRLAKGTDAQVLTLASGLPSWATASAGGAGSSEGAFSALPTASTNSGLLYLPNNASSILRSNGTAWHTWGPIYPLTPPVVADYSWINNVGSGYGETVGPNDLFLYDGTSGSDNVRLRIKDTNSGASTVVACVVPVFPTATGSVAEGGLVIRDSGFGFITFGVRWESGVSKLAIQWWDSATTRTAAYTTIVHQVPLGVAPIFLKFVTTGSDPVHYHWSPDGINWVQVLSENITSSNLDPGFMNQAGYYFNYTNSGTGGPAVAGVKLISLKNS